MLVMNVQEEETLVHKTNVLWGLCVQASPVRNVCGFCDLLMTTLKLLVGGVGWGPFILSWVYGIFPMLRYIQFFPTSLPMQKKQLCRIPLEKFCHVPHEIAWVCVHTLHVSCAEEEGACWSLPCCAVPTCPTLLHHYTLCVSPLYSQLRA